MVPANSFKVSRAPNYSGYQYRLIKLPVRDYHPVSLIFPNDSNSLIKQMSWSYNPHLAETKQVWANPHSLATTNGITFVFFSYGYLDVSVPHVRSPYGVSCLQHDGLSHSEILGSNLACKSPRLIAAYHVLHRL